MNGLEIQTFPSPGDQKGTIFVKYMLIRQKCIKILHGAPTPGRTLGCYDRGSLTRLAKTKGNMVFELQLGGQMFSITKSPDYCGSISNIMYGFSFYTVLFSFWVLAIPQWHDNAPPTYHISKSTPRLFAKECQSVINIFCLNRSSVVFPSQASFCPVHSPVSGPIYVTSIGCANSNSFQGVIYVFDID